ncbi:MAG TPA: helix-turn-helix domain-containing protein [Blastocatellia bacterium]|nr:helix-turn-helix domain-containing protein [Blastocatellia bacterium]HMX25676.1 helix-turn-helix domain-containing protein [Blastocatellia bacterium]HMZ17395.1 helix-turn-helix domain-containing protein [Blastocatellia bacterium]HNG29233.1 helix-turn-helix domain-containing protein [Blastocatellia bacterium]
MTPLFQRLQEVFNTTNSAEIARQLGLERQTLYRWRDGRNIPSLENLYEITKCTNVSLHWLLTGEGEKYVAQSGTLVPKKLALLETAVDTAPAPALIPEIGQPTGQHRLKLVPLLGTVKNQRIVKEKSSVLVPNSLVDEASVLLRIEGEDLQEEGLQDGDILIAKPVTEETEAEGKIVVAIHAGKTFIRHYTKTKKLGLLSPIEGTRPVIKAIAGSIEIKYVVTSITRSFK